MPPRLALPPLALSILFTAVAVADDAPKAGTVEQIAEAVHPSIAVLTVSARDGKGESLGTGFVISADGLIATNFHVIDVGRGVTVELADGKQYEATAVHAYDRERDLAVIRIDAKGLTPLELGDSTAMKDGQAVVAVGNPRGLKRSVVAGVLSSRREVEGKPMLQLAIPIEPGNSGGPVVDMDGKVVGVVSSKSLVTPNLGFAVAVESLKPLLDKAHPVPMSAWLTIGALDADDWKAVQGARWRQRAGRIQVEGQGAGFGGRSLCLWQHETPALPYDVSVAVRLDDEAGAAGLAFRAEDDKHYGFYPSAGKLRLTRFDGPDVYSWHVLREEASPDYRPGEWNVLKVHLEKDKIRCYVNDKLAIESDDAAWTTGKVGLAKFRNTVAEFKQFRVGKELPSAAPTADAEARVLKAIDKLLPEESPKPDLLDKLTPDAAAPTVLLQRAGELEKRAAQMRKLAGAVQERAVLAELDRALKGKEEEIDLLSAALLIARLDNDEVDTAAYRAEVDRMAEKIKASLPDDADETAKREALNKYLFVERGFHGSRGDYYDRANSHLSEVIDDREGLPITLSVLYMDLGRRLGLKIEGVGMPGHFIVRHVPAKGDAVLIDVFEGGKVMTKEEAAKKVEETSGETFKDEFLAAAPKRAIVSRMLHNLLNLARRDGDAVGGLRYLDAILVATPDAVEERLMRAGGRWQTGDRDGALLDIDWLLDRKPEGVDLERVRELRRLVTQPEK
jgi:regulator of sirC expression with transglutaminase-like and TPR domain